MKAGSTRLQKGPCGRGRACNKVTPDTNHSRGYRRQREEAAETLYLADAPCGRDPLLPSDPTQPRDPTPGPIIFLTQSPHPNFHYTSLPFLQMLAMARIQILPLSYCVTLGKLLSFF